MKSTARNRPKKNERKTFSRTGKKINGKRSYFGSVGLNLEVIWLDWKSTVNASATKELFEMGGQCVADGGETATASSHDNRPNFALIIIRCMYERSSSSISCCVSELLVRFAASHCRSALVFTNTYMMG